jgi:hypothetical protein
VPVIPAYLDGVWGSMFSFSGGRFFSKWPRKIPYPARFRIGEPIPPREAKTDRVRQAIQRLAREAFAERPDMQRPLPELLEAALSKKAGTAFLSIPNDGINWTRRDILALAKQNAGQAIDEDTSWQDALPALLARALKGNDIQTNGIPWDSAELQANGLRLPENHLWSQGAFQVKLEGSLDSTWDQTWLLWAPIFGQVSATLEADGILTLRRPGYSGNPPDQPFEGLAVPGLGVICMNMPDPLCETDPNNQKGAAEGSFGRLLPGLELRPKKGSDESSPDEDHTEFEVASVTGAWHSIAPRLRIDGQGFVFPKEDGSGE